LSTLLVNHPIDDTSVVENGVKLSIETLSPVNPPFKFKVLATLFKVLLPACVVGNILLS